MPYSELLKGRHSQPSRIYFITTVILNRTPYFTDFNLGRLIVNEMRRLDEEKLVQSIAWVLMPEHLHWLLQLGEEKILSEVIKMFKGRSARALNRSLQRQGPIWQKSYYDHAIRKEEDIQEIARYIVVNPLRRGLVTDIGQYSFWDAIWL